MSEVVVLQHVDCEGLGTIQEAIENVGHSIRYVRGDLGESVPESLENAAALVVMGGPMSVYDQDRLPFLKEELKLIKHSVAAGKPILGICLGSQLLASALGANVRPGPRKEIGWYPVFLETGSASDRLFRGLPEEFEAFHWHGDIFDLPEAAEKLVHSELTACQAYRFENAYGILFHMEVTPASVQGMANTFDQELSVEAIAVDQLIEDTGLKLTKLQPIAKEVFARWVALIG